MKTLKIFALPSHQQEERTSGVDFARVIQPMKHLDGYEHGGYKFKVHIYHPKTDKGMDWRVITKEYDAIYFNYTANPWAFATMGAMARKNGVPMILDFDDNLWGVMPDNPSYNVYKKGSEGIRNFTAIVNEVDYVTCTNNYLKNVIAHNSIKTHDQIKVFDNYIDLDLYSHRSKPKNDHQINLVHFGSTTHFIDLQNEEFEAGVDEVMKKYPNVVFKTIGAMIPKYRYKWGRRYINSYGDQDIYKWIKEKYPIFMDEASICVVPLADNPYTRCKSAIKFLEMSAAIKPGVWQDIRQYQAVVKHGENGFLASRSHHWSESISKLIDNPNLRRKVGQEAFKTVREHYQIQDHIREYAEYFVEVLTK